MYAAAREPIDHRDPLGEAERVVEQGEHRHGREVGRLRSRGERRESGDRFDELLIVEVALAESRTVESDFLHQIDLLVEIRRFEPAVGDIVLIQEGIEQICICASSPMGSVVM